MGRSQPTRRRWVVTIAAAGGAALTVTALLWLYVKPVPALLDDRHAPTKASQGATTVHGSSAPPLPTEEVARTVEAPGGGRMLYGEYQGDESQPYSARHPQLEEALNVEDADPAWSQRVERSAREILAKDPAIRSVHAQCAQTFCRVRIVKPTESALGWPAIDAALSIVAQGEAIFQTEDNKEGVSTGYLYFSARDAHLPLAALDSLGDPEEP
jgi:hypothetical protein